MSNFAGKVELAYSNTPSCKMCSSDHAINPIEHVFQRTDYLGVTTYNGDLNTLHLPMQVSKIDPSRDKAGIRRGLLGNTAPLGPCMFLCTPQ
jgi:hypothetical protein